MYICDFSRSVGAGSATTRKMRGLTRSVMALIVPPLPAPSRPSNRMQTLRPSCTTHCWSLTNSTCSRASSCSYSLRFSLPLDSGASFLALDIGSLMAFSPVMPRQSVHDLDARPGQIGIEQLSRRGDGCGIGTQILLKHDPV